jgi:PPP family 3-phenylpropionic acid transporter
MSMLIHRVSPPTYPHLPPDPNRPAAVWRDARFGLFYLGYYGYIGVLTPFVSLFFAWRGYSVLEIASLVAVFQITRIVGPYLWGWLSDRLDTRVRIMRTIACLALLVFLLVPATHSFAGMMVLMVVLNFLTSGLSPLGDALTITWLRHSPQGFDKRYGHIRMWGSAGFIATVLGGGALLELFGTGLFPWLAIAMLAALTVVLWCLNDIQDRTVYPPPPPVLMLLRRADVNWFFFSAFCMMFAHAALYVFYSLWLEQLGYSKFVIGAMWTIGVVAEIILFLFQGQLFQRWSLLAILAGTFILAALRFGAIGYLAEWWWVLALVQILHAATFAAHHSASLKRLQHWFAGPLQARGQALYTGVSYGLGGTLGGLAMGAAWNEFGPAHTFGLAAVVSLVGAAASIIGFRSSRAPTTTGAIS